MCAEHGVFHSFVPDKILAAEDRLLFVCKARQKTATGLYTCPINDHNMDDRDDTAEETEWNLCMPKLNGRCRGCLAVHT